MAARDRERLTELAGPGAEVLQTLNPAPSAGTNVAGPFGFETDDQGWVIKGSQTMTWRRGSPGRSTACISLLGSSRRAPGQPLLDRRRPLDPGFIPACAGAALIRGSREDAGGVLRVQRHEGEKAGLGRLAVARRINGGIGEAGERRLPVRDRLAAQRGSPADVEDARRVLGTLAVAAHPIEIVGRAAQHLTPPPPLAGEGDRCPAPHSSSTHVSLVPPPWLELTTSEPLRSATRVRRSTASRDSSMAGATS